MDYRYIFTLKRLWIIFAISLIVSFSVLLFIGGRVFKQSPPIPEKIVTQSGTQIYTSDDIQAGMDVWRRLGGMQLGSVWGMAAIWPPIGRLMCCTVKPSICSMRAPMVIIWRPRRKTKRRCARF